jgi:23S rRNA pseudouridine1911/1915/1917 synthase
MRVREGWDGAAVTLAARLRQLHPGASGRAIKQWLQTGRVRVDGHVVRRGDAIVGAAGRVELGHPAGPRFPPSLGLVFEDEDILVVDKPPGLLTIASDREREHTAYRLLAAYVGAHGSAPLAARRGAPRLFIVHRLDRQTSGLLVFARSAAAKRSLQDQFEARAVERRYVAVVEGAVRDAEGTLRSRLHGNRALRVRPVRDRAGGREAITDYRVIGRGRTTTLLALSLVTGRRGQIRAQLAALGHPIVGDRSYGARSDPLGRLCLHATRLAFTHPRGHRATFDSPAPPRFAQLLPSRAR